MRKNVLALTSGALLPFLIAGPRLIPSAPAKGPSMRRKLRHNPGKPELFKSKRAKERAMKRAERWIAGWGIAKTPPRHIQEKIELLRAEDFQTFQKLTENA